MSASATSLLRSAEKCAAICSQFHPVRKARISTTSLARLSRKYTTDSRPRVENRREPAIRPPRRQDAYPRPRSSYDTGPAPAPPPRKPQFSNSETATFLHDLFQPHLPSSQPLPEEIAARIVTHSSWNKGMEGHNGRLIFLGRRVLNAYLTLFLTSHPAPTLQQDIRNQSGKKKLDKAYPEPDFNLVAVTEHLLDTYILGEHVGGVWSLEKVMRWTPIRPVSTAPTPGSTLRSALRSSGLYKVRGNCVEASIGGIFHQYGGTISHQVFLTHILPCLCKEGLGFPGHLVEDVQKLQLSFKGVPPSLRTPTRTEQDHQETTPQSVSYTVASNIRSSSSSTPPSTSQQRLEPVNLKV